MEPGENSGYLFSAYNEQLRAFYAKAGHRLMVANVGHEFRPDAFATWFQERIPAWAKWSGNGHATPHVCRKTTLQHARRGEDLNDRVAADARVSTAVVLKHYVLERDEELRAASNRTYRRIVASLPTEVARLYGYVAEPEEAKLQARIREATESHDWKTLADLARQLAEAQHRA